MIDINLDDYDVVFQNYCARLIFPGYVSGEFLSKLKNFRGLKILAVQDEYDNTNLLHEAVKHIGYHIVLTAVPSDQVALVYPPEKFPSTEFVTVLTGYVPEAAEINEVEAIPLRDRPIVIGYRGRDIGARYGQLGFDKLEIGRRMREICEARGIVHDIDWTDESRIYGSAWYSFIGRCRAVLGAESGSNVFDFDGEIAATYQRINVESGGRVAFEEFRRYTDPFDARFDIGQISPRIFEAAALRTPMVLYSGRYSGAMRAGEHYIELKKDFSNVEEVLAQLEDFDELEHLADRAYSHLIASGSYSYASFAALVDKIIVQKAAELGLPLSRPDRERLPSEPTPDRESLATLNETPTHHPRHIVFFYYKEAAKEIEVLRSELSAIKRHPIRFLLGRPVTPKSMARLQVLYTLLTDRAGLRLLNWFALRANTDRLILVDAARIVAARNAEVPVGSRPEKLVLVPRLVQSELELTAIPATNVSNEHSSNRWYEIIGEANEVGVGKVKLVLPSNLKTNELLPATTLYLGSLSVLIKQNPLLTSHLILGSNPGAARLIK